MRYDRGYGREFERGRGYDSGLRGFRDTAAPRGRVPLREEGEGRYRGHGSTPRVTRSYNREYVHPDPYSRPRSHVPYGGDAPGRIVGPDGYWRPYTTVGGSRTMRGGGQPVGWEREAARGGYGRGPRGYGRGEFDRGW